jgi:hypothetical protein
MPLSRFPEKAYLDVRLRIIQQNVAPSPSLLVQRVRAVGEAANRRDAQALRGALADLAAISIQAAGHKEVLKLMGANPPVIPVRYGKS